MSGEVIGASVFNINFIIAMMRLIRSYPVGDARTRKAEFTKNMCLVSTGVGYSRFNNYNACYAGFNVYDEVAEHYSTICANDSGRSVFNNSGDARETSAVFSVFF